MLFKFYILNVNKSKKSKPKDALGRKVKGRGLMRFTGRSRSRSMTPPHWRRAVEERLRLNAEKKNRDDALLLKKQQQQDNKEEGEKNNVDLAGEKERTRRRGEEEVDKKNGEESRAKKSRRSGSVSEMGEGKQQRSEKRHYNDVKFKYNENEDESNKRAKNNK